MPVPSSSTERRRAAQQPAAVYDAEALGELGRTTSPRGWLALVALFLVVIVFAAYGLFGSIPVQTTTPAHITNGAYPVQIAAGVEGTVSAITIPGRPFTSGPAGTPIMTIQPLDGGKPRVIRTPARMGVSLDVVLGSPVQPDTVVAHGYSKEAIQIDRPGAQVYAFVGVGLVETLANAKSMTVTPTTPSLERIPSPIRLSFVGSAPVSQNQISLITGNTIYAQQAYADADGAPYLVIFDYVDPADAEAVGVRSAALITATESTPHPLQLLFSQ